LAKYAIGLLSIPIEATLPFEPANEFGEELDYSVDNNFAYIEMSQKIEEMERNALIHVNKRLW
jgi:hypothetical protein